MHEPRPTAEDPHDLRRSARRALHNDAVTWCVRGYDTEWWTARALSDEMIASLYEDDGMREREIRAVAALAWEGLR